MSSLSMNKASLSEAPAAPNFVLSLLAFCSTSVPAVGTGGAAAFSDQLSALLQNKVMAENELHMLYSYTFGVSVNDAMKWIGFQGKLQDFLNQDKRFCVHGGRVSVNPLLPATKDEAPTGVDEFLPQCDVPTSETGSNNNAGSCQCEGDPSIRAIGWYSVGKRVVAALEYELVAQDDLTKTSDDDDTAAVFETEGTVDADSCQSDSDSSVSMIAWHSVGKRFAAALDYEDYEPAAQGVLTKNADDDDTASVAETESTIDADFSQGDSDSSVSVIAWHYVGKRFAAALDYELGAQVAPTKHADDDDTASVAETESTMDAASWQSDSDSSVSMIAWRSVGKRFAAALGCEDYGPAAQSVLTRNVDDDDTASVAGTESAMDVKSWRGDSDSSVSMADWHSVGKSFAAALVYELAAQDDLAKTSDDDDDDDDDIAETGSTREAESWQSDSDSSVSKIDWHSVGKRVAATLYRELGAQDALTKNADGDDTASVAGTESTMDAESWQSDSDSGVSMIDWHSVGKRVAAALDYEVAAQNALTKDADDDDTTSVGETESTMNAESWQSDSDSSNSIIDWHSVGKRVAAALGYDLTVQNALTKDAGDDDTASVAETESTMDAGSCQSDSDSSVSIIDWHSVGKRVVAALDCDLAAQSALTKDADDDDTASVSETESTMDAGSCQSDRDSSVSIIDWHSVGKRVVAALTSELGTQDALTETADDADIAPVAGTESTMDEESWQNDSDSS